MMSREVAVGLGVLAGLVVGGGIAYAATSSKPAAAAVPSSGDAAKAPTPTLPSGAPQGMVSTGPTSSGWQVTVQLGALSGVSYPALLGDRITVQLPAGAHWSAKAGVTSLGPTSGADPYSFMLIEQVAFQFTWTDATNTDHTTVLYFGDVGVTFVKVTRLSTYDYVLLAIFGVDFEQLVVGITQWPTLASATAIQRQEAANIAAASAAMVAANPPGVGLSPQQLLLILLAVGPWADSFAPDVRQVVPYPIGATLPSWIPSDDTHASTEAHVVYRYVGPGIDVASLPFPVTAWRRVA